MALNKVGCIDFQLRLLIQPLSPGDKATYSNCQNSYHFGKLPLLVGILGVLLVEWYHG